MTSLPYNSKTTFVTVNHRIIIICSRNQKDSKTTFVTVNRKKGKVDENKTKNSKTTFVTVNLFVCIKTHRFL